MPYPPRIILHCPIAEPAQLDRFVERCLTDRVALIAVVGNGAAAVEELLDEIIVADGRDPGRFILTTSHPDETTAEVLDLIALWGVGEGTEVEQVRL